MNTTKTKTALSPIAASQRRSWIAANCTTPQAAMLNKIIMVGGEPNSRGEGWFHEVTATPTPNAGELATLRSLVEEELVTLHEVSSEITWITLAD